jgi:hypothetical protein
MENFRVSMQITLDVEALDEDEAKQKVIEDLSDFLRHHSLIELMKVEKNQI